MQQKKKINKIFDFQKPENRFNVGYWRRFFVFAKDLICGTVSYNSPSSDDLKFNILAPKLNCFLNENVRHGLSENPFLMMWRWDIWALDHKNYLKNQEDIELIQYFLPSSIFIFVQNFYMLNVKYENIKENMRDKTL